MCFPGIQIWNLGDTLSLGFLFEWSYADLGVEAGIMVWSRGATWILISRNINRKGITRMRSSSKD